MNTVKISEVALESGKKNPQVLEACKTLSIDAKTAGSAVTLEEAQRLMAYLAGAAVPSASKPKKARKTPVRKPAALIDDSGCEESLVRGYTLAKPPQWPCPACGHLLRLLPQKREVIENSAKSQGGWTGRFTDTLECTRPGCGQRVIVTGEAEDWSLNSRPKRPGDEPAFYRPQSCTPALSFFDLPQETPQEVAKAFALSFDRFFDNPQVAADALKTACAALLETLKHKEGGAKDKLLRLKWANPSSPKAAKEALLKQYRFFDGILNELYRS